jgi:hypothetical protein
MYEAITTSKTGASNTHTHTHTRTLLNTRKKQKQARAANAELLHTVRTWYLVSPPSPSEGGFAPPRFRPLCNTK